MRGVRLYHTTSHERADNIMRVGFYDNVASYAGPLLGTYRKGSRGRPKLFLDARHGEILFHYPPAVWFSSVPLIDDVLFDANGYFNYDPGQQAFIAIDVARLPIRGIRSSNRDKTWSGTQYWGPASIWNRFPRTRIERDDIIRLRLLDPELRSFVRQCVDRRDPDDPYGDPFHNHVKEILGIPTWEVVRHPTNKTAGATRGAEEQHRIKIVPLAKDANKKN
jgi:hypothetical protein